MKIAVPDLISNSYLPAPAGGAKHANDAARSYTQHGQLEAGENLVVAKAGCEGSHGKSVE